MKTPDEIKNCLGRCLDRWAPVHFESCESDCPYHIEGTLCKSTLHSDVIAYIGQLENAVEFYSNANHMLAAKIAKLKSRLAQVERENKAMLHDMARYTMCGSCKHFADDGKCPQKDECVYGEIGRFEWRGVCEENTKEE